MPHELAGHEEGADDEDQTWRRSSSRDSGPKTRMRTTKTHRTKDPKNLDHQYHPHHTPDTSPRRSSVPRYTQHLCIHNAVPKRRGEVSNVKSLSIRRKGRYIGTNALYKCHIGLCTPRRTIMETKKKQKNNHLDS